MPVDTSLAAAIVRFTGLGILCNNTDDSRAENLFIHEEGHSLTIEIFSPLSVSDNNDYEEVEATGDPGMKKINDYWYQRQALYENFNPGDLEIDIFGENFEDPLNDCTFFRKELSPTTFTRTAGLTGNDVNDFRWVVNATEDGLMGNGNGIGNNCALARLEYLTSKLFISNAELYTETLVKDTGVPVVYNKVPEDNSPTTVYGPIADEIGAHIDTDVVKVNITAGEQTITHTITKTHKPYVIFITNNAVISESDMPVYRKLWTSDPNDCSDLLTDDEVEEKTFGRPITGRELCSGIYTDCPKTILDYFQSS